MTNLLCNCNSTKITNLLYNIDFWTALIAFLALYISLKGLLSDRGSVEIELDRTIKEANVRIRETGLMLVEHRESVRKEMECKYKHPIKDERLIKYLENHDNIYKVKLQMYNSVLQDYLNTFEEACCKYIDRKVSRKRFKSNYKYSIKEICTSGLFDDKLNSKDNTYINILTLYNKWYRRKYQVVLI